MDTGNSPAMEQDRNLEWKKWLFEAKSKLREEDTDWNRWLLGKPHVFRSSCLSGIPSLQGLFLGDFDQWMSHGCDLVHLWTDETYPESVVATGGIYA